MIQVLIVEDEKPISSLIRLSLTKEGCACTCAYDGAQAADLLERNRYDLILLDVMLPEVDGFELMEYIRPLEIPVIFLTARSSVRDRVKGLRLGAEDYIVKPFETIELLARVDVVLRRYKKRDAVLEIGGLRIDTGSMQVWRDGEEICLTRTEYELLLLFARSPGGPSSGRPSTSGCGGRSTPSAAGRWTSTSSACGRRWAGSTCCRRSTRWATGWRWTGEIPSEADAVHGGPAVGAVRGRGQPADHRQLP